MIKDEDVERACDFVRDSADLLAKAKAERVYLDEYKKTKKALLVQKSSGTVQERESFAYAHPEYEQLLEGLKAAVHEEERLRWMMVAAQQKIEVWRSQQANNRIKDNSFR